MATYDVNPDAVAHCRELIEKKQYVLDSDWGNVQPGADAQNAFLERHSWEEYAAWHLDQRPALRRGHCGETRPAGFHRNRSENATGSQTPRATWHQ